MRRGFKLIISLVLPYVAGFVGAFFTTPAIDGWYATLNKPVFNPPGYIFGPVWTVLYFLMGVAFYIAWSSGRLKQKVLWMFLVSLGVNAIWSLVFFGVQNPLGGLIVILVLLAMIIFITEEFWKVDKRAAYLMMPYVVWVSFATVLNFSIWWLN